MKATVLILMAVALAACSPGYEEKHYTVLPAELKDCKFYEVSNGGSAIKVVRCPNSQTTTNWTQSTGKSTITRSAVVIDGAEYQATSAR